MPISTHALRIAPRSSLRRARLAAFFVGACLLFGAPFREARAAGEADRLFQLGRRASEMGKFATACSLFRESNKLEPAVGTLLNLGDCEEQQGHIAAALDYYQDALSRLSVTDDRLAPLRVRIEALEQRSGHLDLKLGQGAPEDAKVIIDGEVISSERRTKPLILAAGAHLLQVTAVGYRGSRQVVELATGEKKALTVWPGPPLDASELSLAVSDDREQVEHARLEARARTMRIVGWSAFGVGVASLWVGSVAGLFAIDRESLRKDNCDANNLCNRTGLDAANSGKTFSTLSTITLAAGAAAVAGGLYVVLSNGGPKDAPKQASAPRYRTDSIFVGPATLAAIPLTGGAAFSFEKHF